MDRDEFLNQANVREFIDWLINTLPSLPVALQVADSRYTPGGIRVQCAGVEEVLANYHWNATWSDPATSEDVRSGNWLSTKQSLERLKDGLDNAVGQQNNLLERYCRAVLDWGGVTGAIPFLSRINSAGELLGYLQSMQRCLRLDGSQHIEELNERTVRRYDSGLTKIHALLDHSGSPIYDSRVGAAIAMLYELHCDDEFRRNPLLQFPVGVARGTQIRNPGQLGFNKAPEFYTARVPHHVWAQAQLKLGWILREVIESTDLFYEEGAIPARCHALEAALFMLGYDLRCFVTGNSGRRQPEVIRNALTYVPTGFSMRRVADLYLEYAEENNFEGLSRANFVDWQVDHGHVRKRSTANANTFPLRVSEFDLYDRSEVSLRSICNGGNEALEVAMDGRYPEPDLRDCVCLIDCLVVGRLRLARQGAAEIIETIMRLGYAGTENSARTMVGVANSAGQYFGLFDQDKRPTPYFTQFFGREGYAGLLPELQ